MKDPKYSWSLKIWKATRMAKKPFGFHGECISPLFLLKAPPSSRAHSSSCYATLKLLYSEFENLNWICSMPFGLAKRGQTWVPLKEEKPLKPDELGTLCHIDKTQKQTKENERSVAFCYPDSVRGSSSTVLLCCV